jgi:hypothetical protein
MLIRLTPFSFSCASAVSTLRLRCSGHPTTAAARRRYRLRRCSSSGSFTLRLRCNDGGSTTVISIWATATQQHAALTCGAAFSDSAACMGDSNIRHEHQRHADSSLGRFHSQRHVLVPAEQRQLQQQHGSAVCSFGDSVASARAVQQQQQHDGNLVSCRSSASTTVQR